VVVVVGSSLLKDYLEWTIVERDICGLNVHILTLAHLAASISTSDSQVPSSIQALPALSTALCTMSIRECKDAGIYQDVVHRPGFLRVLSSTFTDLDDALFEDQIGSTAERYLQQKLTA
jgi:hypothetical protein